jgi:hypothetical protein
MAGQASYPTDADDIQQCPTQSWSASCLIDLYMDAAEYQSGDGVGLSKLSIST